MSTREPPGTDEPSAFVPGVVFANRYRMIALVGRGGMGEVWRADDLVLATPVALKLVRSPSPTVRERLLTEVRLARLITHPAVCRVFDVGETDDLVFYSMELVEGEDLATLLRRAGRLPGERVIAIARQLCDGLAAAHAQGVLHRDLKPANLLIDQDGAIRITDFGIATVRTDTNDRAIVGTPGYMAPEQWTAGAPLSARTDLYALGLVLFELLVGQRPFPGPRPDETPPPRPSALIPDVEPRLERVILQALEPNPQDRPASAEAMAAALPATAAAAPPRSAWPWVAGAVLAAALAMLAVTSSWLWSGGDSSLTDQDTIVLADFVNTTGDPVFDGTLKVALAVALEQSPFLKVFPENAARETLRLMNRQPDEPLTRTLTREIARREQVKALVAGSISRLGSQYVLALEAISTETGDVMAREQTEAAAKEEVLASLGLATSRLRAKLGESLPSIQRYDVPLARATTSSLEALQAYSLALDEGRVFLRVTSIPHLRRAIELDPDFALAHALLSGIYANTGQTAAATPHAVKAYELRDQVSERERFFISWRYYLDALQAWDEALALASSWTTTYPREAFAFNSLGLAAHTFGRQDRAIEAFRQAIRLDPKLIPPYRNLAAALLSLGRPDEVKAVIDDAASQGITSMDLRLLSALATFVSTGSVPEGAANLTGTAEEEMWSIHLQAQAAAFQGRFSDAHAQFQRAAQLAVREAFGELAARWVVEDAEAHAVAGQCEAAGQEVRLGLNQSRDNFLLERAGRTLALCGDADAAADLAAELAARYPNATLTTRVHRPVIAAALALGAGDGARARDLLESVATYERAPAAEFWPRYLRGQAHLRLQNTVAADGAFRSILDHRGDSPTSPLYPLAQLGLARAAVRAGDGAAARTAYEAFFALWAAADSDLPALRDAREEYARLQ